jgi:hypothetical protein
MNVEIRAEAALFPEKEYISGICIAVCGASAVFIYLVWDTIDWREDEREPR